AQEIHGQRSDCKQGDDIRFGQEGAAAECAGDAHGALLIFEDDIVDIPPLISDDRITGAAKPDLCGSPCKSIEGNNRLNKTASAAAGKCFPVSYSCRGWIHR